MRKLLQNPLSFLLVTILLIYGCAPKVAAPSESDVARGQKKYPDLTMNELETGRTIFMDNCNLCHGYYQPSSETEDEWLGIVPEMSKKVNNKLGTEKITAKDQELLLRYVITMGSASP